jgi:transposase
VAKDDYEFKKAVVEAYQNGKDGYLTIAHRYGISSDSTVKEVEMFL